MSGGRRQSPVDILPDRLERAGPRGLPGLRFEYSSRATLDKLELTPEGRPGHPTGTVLVTAAHGAGQVRVGDSIYHLLQFHWHWPGEHQLAGRGFPAEMHLVHRKAGSTGLDDLVVVGVWMEIGAAHTEIEKIFGRLPADPTTGTVAGPIPDFDLTALLPVGLESFRYPGSLTAPTVPQQSVFLETVDWVLLNERMEMSSAQLARLEALFPEGNSRCVQPLCGRTIRTDVRPENG